MKDTIITGATKKRELVIFIFCLALAFLLNVFSILRYGTQWNELYTMWYVVLLLAIFLYIISWLVRGLVKLALVPFKHR